MLKAFLPCLEATNIKNPSMYQQRGTIFNIPLTAFTSAFTYQLYIFVNLKGMLNCYV